MALRHQVKLAIDYGSALSPWQISQTTSLELMVVPSVRSSGGVSEKDPMNSDDLPPCSLSSWLNCHNFHACVCAGWFPSHPSLQRCQKSDALRKRLSLPNLSRIKKHSSISMSLPPFSRTTHSSNCSITTCPLPFPSYFQSKHGLELCPPCGFSTIPIR